MEEILGSKLDFDFLMKLLLGFFIIISYFKNEIYNFIKNKKVQEQEIHDKITKLTNEITQVKESVMFSKQELNQEIELLKSEKASHKELRELIDTFNEKFEKINNGISRLEGILERGD